MWSWFGEFELTVKEGDSFFVPVSQLAALKVPEVKVTTALTPVLVTFQPQIKMV